jgi:hypothetical protein
MTDRVTKVALIAIAAGLWANFAISLLPPRPAHADDYAVQQIQRDVSAISGGVCVNRKIC